MRERRSARLLVLSPDNHLLLFRFVHREGPLAGSDYWATPGGALEPGESFEDAAVRELYEETGIRVDGVGEPVACRDFSMQMPDGEWVRGIEQLYVVRAPSDVLSWSHWTDEERAVIADHRWWRLDELRHTLDTVWPENLPALLEEAGVAERAAPRHFNPDHYLETPQGRVFSQARNAEAWRRATAALDAALAKATFGARLYLVIGVQGSGKSHWIERHIGILGTLHFFFDAALPRAEHRAPLLAIAQRHRIPVIAVWLDTPLALAKQRNQARRADHRVPNASLEAVFAAFEPPTLEEGFVDVRVVLPSRTKADAV